MNRSIGYHEADVVIAGGGTGGVCAAISSARNGVDTLLIERQGFLGGLFTGGNMCVSTFMPWSGLGKEIFDILVERDAATFHPDDPANYPIFHHRQKVSLTVPYDPEMAKLILFEMVEEAGVRLLLHSYVCGTMKQGTRVKGVIIENKSGRQIVKGNIICDGTGDGAIAASVGAQFVKGQGDEKKLLAMTMLVRLSNVDWCKVTEYSQEDPGWKYAISKAIQKGELLFYSPRSSDMIAYWGHPRPELSRLWYDDGALLWGGTVEGVDGTNIESLTMAEVLCRKQWTSEVKFLKKHIPGFETLRVENSGISIGVRATRHFVGEYTYTGYDLLEERVFHDTVAYIVPQFLGVPYRCLLPKEVDDLIISSKCISVTPGSPIAGPTLGAYNDMKSLTTVMTYGQAAGTAAALCIKNEACPRKLDIHILQNTLTKQGLLLSQTEINQLMQKKLPNGMTYKEHLHRYHTYAQQHWRKMGYEFSTPQQHGRTKKGRTIAGLFEE